MSLRRVILQTVPLGLLCMALPAEAVAPGGGVIVGILEGSATLIRRSQRHAVVEGLALQADDIVETAPAAFVQIEMADGPLIGLGEGSRLMLLPSMTRDGPARKPLLYLLEGWLKIRQTKGASTARGGYVSPGFELDSEATVAVLQAGR